VGGLRFVKNPVLTVYQHRILTESDSCLRIGQNRLIPSTISSNLMEFRESRKNLSPAVLGPWSGKRRSRISPECYRININSSFSEIPTAEFPPASTQPGPKSVFPSRGKDGFEILLIPVDFIPRRLERF